MFDLLVQSNAFFWVAGNIVVVIITIMTLIFTILYPILFNPNLTLAGKLVFRFALSLCGIILLVYVGTWVDPSHGREWSNFPGDIVPWRPFVRFLIYCFAAYTITSLTVFIIVRKWWPHRIKNTSARNLLTPRHETGPIDVIKEGASS